MSVLVNRVLDSPSASERLIFQVVPAHYFQKASNIACLQWVVRSFVEASALDRYKLLLCVLKVRPLSAVKQQTREHVYAMIDWPSNPCTILNALQRSLDSFLVCACFKWMATKAAGSAPIPI